MATITISNTGGNWNATGTWVGGVIPGAADDVIATATSGPLTVTNSPSVISLNFTNYTNTFSVNSGVSLTLTGGITMVAGMSVSPSSTGTLIFTSSQTITSGGQVWPGNLVFSLTNSRIYTLGDNWVVNGNFSTGYVGPFTATFASNQMSIKGNFTIGSNASATNSAMSGSTVIVLSTETSQTVTSNITIQAVRMQCPLAINATGTVIFSTPTAAIRLGNVTYTAGDVVSVGATLQSFGGFVFTTSLMTWDCNWFFQSTAATFTFGSDFNIGGSGSLELNGLSGAFILNGNSINLYGDFFMTYTGFGGNITGTTIVNFLGDCTISQQSGMQLRLPIVINSSGTVTFSTSFTHGNTLTYTAGGFSMSTALEWGVNISTTYTFNSPGFSFPNFVTLLTHTFAGSHGCNFYSYSISTTAAGIQQIFQSANTYNITNSLNLLGTAANTLTFRSSSSGSRAIVTLYYGASMDVGHVTATDIDSSGGQTVWNYKGTISNTLNWQALPIVPKTIGVPWVR